MKAAANPSNESHQSKANAHHVAQQPTSQGLSFEPPEAKTLMFEDKRPEAVAQRKLQAMMDASPMLTAQRKLQAMVNNSPLMVAQRTQWERWFGGAAQARFSEGDEAIQGDAEPVQKQENKTGLPDNLKSGIEKLTGYSMDDVKVHKNSSKPAELQALAYTQGTDIHVGPGQ